MGMQTNDGPEWEGDAREDVQLTPPPIPADVWYDAKAACFRGVTGVRKPISFDRRFFPRAGEFPVWPSLDRPDVELADGRVADFKTTADSMATDPRLAELDAAADAMDAINVIDVAVTQPKDFNPKTAAGQAKPAMEFVPPGPLMSLAAVMRGGAEKYGPFNWRDQPVSETTYYSAAHRHLAAWFDGETYDPDSGQHQLAHVMACCAIIMDATACNTIHHDRPTPGPAAEVMRNLAGLERQRHK